MIPVRTGELWHVGLSFGPSKSPSFERALYLAEQAPVFSAGEGYYLASYTDKPREFLAFVRLYELVRTWKSCQVIIGGEFVDRKIVGAINYCYGDKCRSGKDDFCFGASEMTENPFGCHRIQSWKFRNKAELLKRIEHIAMTYAYCPAFDVEHILGVYKGLPEGG